MASGAGSLAGFAAAGGGGGSVQRSESESGDVVRGVLGVAAGAGNSTSTEMAGEALGLLSSAAAAGKNS